MVVRRMPADSNGIHLNALEILPRGELSRIQRKYDSEKFAGDMADVRFPVCFGLLHKYEQFPPALCLNCDNVARSHVFQ